MKTILLGKSGFAAVCDDEDYARLSHFKWYCVPGKNTWYASRMLPDNGSVQMHVDVLGKRPGYIIDHADRNGLNNQRENLRWATVSQNGTNRIHVTSTGFRGVRPGKNGGWLAITKGIKLGWFTTKEEAAMTYNWAAELIYGDFAVLNAMPTGHLYPPSRPSPAIADQVRQLAKTMNWQRVNKNNVAACVASTRSKFMIKRNGVWTFKRKYGNQLIQTSLQTGDLKTALSHRAILLGCINPEHSKDVNALVIKQAKKNWNRKLQTHRATHHLLLRNGVWTVKIRTPKGTLQRSLQTKDLQEAIAKRDTLIGGFQGGVTVTETIKNNATC